MLRIHPQRAFIEPAVSIQRVEKSGATATAVLRIDGLLCSLCAQNVRGHLEAHDSVREADVDLDAGSATVTYDADRIDPADLRAAAESAVVLRPLRRWLGKIRGRGA